MAAEAEAACFKGLDTTRASLVHMLAPKSWGCADGFWAKAVPLLVTAGLFYVLPSLLALFTLPTLVSDPALGIRLGYLEDYNSAFMFLVSFPLVVLFLLAERRVIAGGIGAVVESPVVVRVREDARALCAGWSDVYRKANLWGQIVGMIVGAVIGYLNYRAILADPHTFQGYQGRVTALGWVLVILQVPLFYMLLTLYFVRGVTTWWVLKRLVGSADLEIDSFNPDNAGGLAPIGSIGLRNQYLLAAIGVNVLLLWHLHVHAPSHASMLLCILAVCAYIVFGPLAFLLPLLPFRKKMLDAKRREQERVGHRLREEYLTVLGSVEAGGVAKEAMESLDRLRDLKRVVDGIPVWPYDAATRRRFLSAYASPVVVWLLGWFGPSLVASVLRGVFGSG